VHDITLPSLQSTNRGDQDDEEAKRFEQQIELDAGQTDSRQTVDVME